MEEKESQTKTQNYILVMCDDLGYGDTGFNGHPHIQTPYLDQLASEGATLTRFYSGAPVCSPTRATCLTGRHAYRLGVFTANSGHLPRQEVTIAELLKQKGYTTGFFGKWHLGALSTTTRDGRRGGLKGRKVYSPPWDHHFDTCFASESQMPLWNPMENQRFPAKYWTSEERYETENLDGDDSRVIMDRVIPFIKHAHTKNQPFLAVVWFHTPHEPVRAGPEYRKLYSELDEKTQHYYGCITAMDEQIGRLNQTVKDLSLESNTMVWFCSDNGPESSKTKDGCPTGIGSTGSLRGRKRSLFNGGIQGPTVLKWPKYSSFLHSGSTIDFPMSTLDYLPTILTDAELSMPDGRPIDGVDLISVFQTAISTREKPIPFRFRASKIKMSGSPTFGLIDGRMKLLTNFSSNPQENFVFDVVGDCSETTQVEDRSEFIKQSKQFLVELLQSFEKSHRGGDYSGAPYKPVNKYLANSLGWEKRANRKRPLVKLYKKFRKSSIFK